MALDYPALVDPARELRYDMADRIRGEDKHKVKKEGSAVSEELASIESVIDRGE